MALSMYDIYGSPSDYIRNALYEANDPLEKKALMADIPRIQKEWQDEIEKRKLVELLKGGQTSNVTPSAPTRHVAMMPNSPGGAWELTNEPGQIDEGRVAFSQTPQPQAPQAPVGLAERLAGAGLLKPEMYGHLAAQAEALAATERHRGVMEEQNKISRQAMIDARVPEKVRVFELMNKVDPSLRGTEEYAKAYQDWDSKIENDKEAKVKMKSYLDARKGVLQAFSKELLQTPPSGLGAKLGLTKDMGEELKKRKQEALDVLDMEYGILPTSQGNPAQPAIPQTPGQEWEEGGIKYRIGPNGKKQMWKPEG